MTEDLERAWLQACQRQFEIHLQWGPVARWSQRDFENLSELISEKTGVLVSVTTLKRALGRVGFKGLPFHSTLNAMVQFLGYPDWAHFKSHPEFLESFTPESLVRSDSRFQGWNKRFWLGFSFLILLNTGFWMLFLYRQPNNSDVETTDFADTRLQTQEGKADSIPHMVHVDYSVPKSLWKDLLLISLGDGHLDFAKIDSAGRGQLSHRYLDFGYYPVKLFSNRRLLSLLPVLIANPTWLVSVADEHNRNMISVKPILREGVLTLREKDAYRFTQDTLTRVGVQFRKFQDFGVEGDNCTAEFRIRCPANTSNRHTPKVTIKLSFRNESAYFTLDKSNTARSYYHKISDFIMPLTDQIRYFRQDISDWSILTFENQNKNYRIRLNDKIIYEGKYSQKLGPLYGIQMRFVGIGEIDHVLIYDKNRNLVFRENF